MTDNIKIIMCYNYFFILVSFLFLTSCNSLVAQIEHSSEIVTIDTDNDRGTDSLDQNANNKSLYFKKGQFGLNVGGLYNYSISYLRRISDSNFGIGLDLGFAFEHNSHNFDRNIWEALSIAIFGRYQYKDFIQLDFGTTFMGYFYTDDCSECTGNFIGLDMAAMIGKKFVFVGPRLRFGAANDNRNRSETGVLYNIQVRLVF